MTTRRDIIAGVAVAPFVRPAPATASTSADAELLSLRPAWLEACRHFDAAIDAKGVVEERIFARSPRFPDFETWEGSYVDYAAAVARVRDVLATVEEEEGKEHVDRLEGETCDAQTAVLEQIEALQARTLAGLRFKVEVSIREDHNRAELIQSIMDDIVALEA